MSEMLVVNSKVREAVKATGKSMSSDFSERISEKVHALIADAVKRARDNGRATVMAKDV
jgi:histone H3/H4